jgi:hypothetical protein
MAVGLDLVVGVTPNGVAKHRESLNQQGHGVGFGVRLDSLDDFTNYAMKCVLVQLRQWILFRFLFFRLAGFLRSAVALPAELPPELQVVVARFREGIPERRRGKSNLFYAQLARDYVEYWSKGLDPISTIKTRREIESKSKARDMVREARRRELLSAISAGRPGGRLTPKAIALLESDPDAKTKGNVHGRIGKTKKR